MTHDEKRYELSKELIASKLTHDKRIAEARQLLHAAVKDYQQSITEVRPPNTAVKTEYDETVKLLSHNRGGNLWFPYIGSGIGNGALVELADGSIKYDFICGIGVHFFGHNHPDLLDSGINAALSNTIMQGHLQQNLDAAELISFLLHASGFDHCFLTTTGTMANENAFKIAFQKNHPANRVLAFEHCFAGRSLAMAQVTDKPGFREGLPPNIIVDYVPFFDPAEPEKSTEKTIQVLKSHLKRYPKQHALMIFELIQGEAGFNCGDTQFFKSIMTLLKENNVGIMVDEIQSFGRTTELFAFQYFGLESYVDIVTIGKMSQTCATLFKNEFKPKPGLLSQTFSSSTSGIKGSLVILKNLINGGYYGPQGKIAKLHEYFVSQLTKLEKRHPDLIQGPYGIGCMIAFTPYKGDPKKVHDFIRRLYEAGVISFSAGGEGKNLARVRFLIPAGVVTHKDIDQVILITERELLC